MIKDILKRHRKALGISQAKLAAHVGFNHRSSIHRLEQGHIEWKYRDVVKACELLKLKMLVKEME